MIRSTPPQSVRDLQRGFSLVELLVVIGILAVLIGLLMPVLSTARSAARRTQCLSNLRNMQIAHWNYVVDNKGYIIQAGLAHAGLDANEPAAWIVTLQKYYGQSLLHRCPSDISVHWFGGLPVPPTMPPDAQWRRTSYGINNYLSLLVAPPSIRPYRKIEQVRNPAVVIHFVEMTYTGDFAGADHPHVENWGSGPGVPTSAAANLQIAAHGNRPIGFEAVANYGFLDGHAESRRFRDVYRSPTINNFDPRYAR